MKSERPRSFAAFPTRSTLPIFSDLSLLVKNVSDRWMSDVKSVNTCRIALNTARGSAARTAFRFSCSAFWKVYCISFTSAFVKVLPPIGTLRWAIFRPLVTTTSVESTPIEISTIDGGGSSGSIDLGSGSWSNITMFASAIGWSWRTSTSMPALVSGASALLTCSFFIAKSATSASITKPLSSMPPASRCQAHST